ncbi:hypothetical protein HHI36_000562 [Cryptolaemus montrouzieri]|uniref:Uncharacterized protein n=1 Tax=Cryptolaemus montrouzieri TaxID=559131 RepID=A0ABD2P545_9CUCU
MDKFICCHKDDDTLSDVLNQLSEENERELNQDKHLNRLRDENAKMLREFEEIELLPNDKIRKQEDAIQKLELRLSRKTQTKSSHTQNTISNMLASGYYKSEGTQTDVVTPSVEITEKKKMARNVKKTSNKQNVACLHLLTMCSGT